jgi:hypothetical protein
MLTYTIRAATLKAASYCVADKHDVRKYLRGVLLDAPPGRVVATDGTILFCGEAPPDESDAGFPAIIIPPDALAALFKALGKSKTENTAVVVRKLDDGTFDLYHVGAGEPIVFAPIDGRFPEYERVIPPVDGQSGVPGSFNPEFLVRGQQALTWFAGRRVLPTLVPNGPHNTALLLGSGNAFCVVMPFRDSAVDTGALDWYRQPRKRAA